MPPHPKRHESIRAEPASGDPVEVLSEFPMTITSSRRGNRRVAGTIGNGGRELRLYTVNGQIHLRKT